MIVGSCSGGSGRTAVRWDESGAVFALPSLGGAESEATGVSDAGTVVGVARDIDGRYNAVRWSAFGVTRLPTMGGFTEVAMDISDSGIVVGRAATPSGRFHAAEWRNAG
jgi:probable HAF family extracellular repeat protein